MYLAGHVVRPVFGPCGLALREEISVTGLSGLVQMLQYDVVVFRVLAEIVQQGYESAATHAEIGLGGSQLITEMLLNTWTDAIGNNLLP